MYKGPPRRHGQDRANKPCPCGSGKKYKRYCLPREQALLAERAAAAARTERVAPSHDEQLVWDDDGLDEASNRVVDLIHAGKLDEAEQAQDLLERYPDVHDGLERLAMLYRARGDLKRAAEYYRRAADFVHAHSEA